MMDGQYGGESEIELAKTLPRALTLSENIAVQLQQARKEVDRLERLGKLLKEHPEVQEILDLLDRRKY